MGKTKRIKIELYIQILIGMVLGIIVGFAALAVGGAGFIQDWIKPWGQLFIHLLQLIAVPLVFVSLVKGVTGLHDISRFSRLGWKTLIFYICTTIFAVLFGVLACTVVKPGALVNKERAMEIQKDYITLSSQKAEEAKAESNRGPLNFLDEVVPDNIVNAASNNSKMLQVIFFAIFLGIAALVVGEKATPVLQFFDSLNDIILKMVDFIIKLAPYGVLALMAGLVTDFEGDASIFSALGIYALTVAISLICLLLFFYPTLIRIFTHVKPGYFIRSMYPVQLFAFTTSSSAVTLPVNLNTVQNKLKVSEEVSSFVLPVGVTINMDGTSCYQAIAVIFIAQVLNIDLTLIQMLTIIFMTVLSSIGTPGIPGGSYVILTMVLTSVGIPAEGLALILGIDRPLDMLRTSVNVTGDATVACIVDGK